MSVENIATYSGPLIANGVTVAFPFSFLAMTTDEVQVVGYDSDGRAVDLPDHSVTLADAAPSTGTVTFEAPPADGIKIWISSSPDFRQQIAFEDGSRWLAGPVNEANDRAAVRSIYLRDAVQRALVVPVGSSAPAVGDLSDMAEGQVIGLIRGKLLPVSNSAAAASADAAQTALDRIAVEAAAVDAAAVAAARTAAEAAAAQAVAAADIAATEVKMYANTGAGLGNTSGTGSTNRYFTVPDTTGTYATLYINNAGSASLVNTYASKSALDAAITAMGNTPAIVTGDGGIIYGSIAPNDGGGGAFDDHVVAGVLGNTATLACSKVRFKLDGAGTGYLVAWDAAQRQIYVSDLLTTSSGINTFTPPNGVMIEPGGNIGYYRVSGGRIYYGSGGPSFYLSPPPGYGTSAFGKNGEVLGLSLDSGTLGVAIEVTLCDPVSLVNIVGQANLTLAQSKNVDFDFRRKRCPILSLDFDTMPVGWLVPGVGNVGGWTISGGALISPSSGQGWSQILLGFFNFIRVENRVLRATIEFTSSDAVVGIGATVDNAVPDGGGSVVTVDIANNLFSLRDRWIEGAAPGTISSVTPSWTLAQNKPYIIEWTLNIREHSVVLIDPDTGRTTAPMTSGDNSTDTSYNDVAGELNNCPAIVAVAGTFKVLDFDMLADQAPPLVSFYGDSIGQGYGIGLVRVADLMRADTLLAGRSVSSSAKSGGTYPNIYQAIINEMPHLRPKLIVVECANSTDDTYNIDAAIYLPLIAQAAIAYGIPVAIAVQVNLSGHTYTNCNALIMSLAASYPETVIPWRWDKAMTVNNDGTTVNAAMFNVDGLHHSALGEAANYARLQVDVPWLFD